MTSPGQRSRTLRCPGRGQMRGGSHIAKKEGCGDRASPQPFFCVSNRPPPGTRGKQPHHQAPAGLLTCASSSGISAFSGPRPNDWLAPTRIPPRHLQRRFARGVAPHCLFSSPAAERTGKPQEPCNFHTPARQTPDSNASSSYHLFLKDARENRWAPDFFCLCGRDRGEQPGKFQNRACEFGKNLL